jgi:hypothetical protein
MIALQCTALLGDQSGSPFYSTYAGQIIPLNPYNESAGIGTLVSGTAGVINGLSTGPAVGFADLINGNATNINTWVSMAGQVSVSPPILVNGDGTLSFKLAWRPSDSYAKAYCLSQSPCYDWIKDCGYSVFVLNP